MRTIAIIGLAALGMLGGLTRTAHAQRPGWPSAAHQIGSADRFAAEPDPLRPYAPEAQAGRDPRPYAQMPLTPPRDEAITRTSAPPARHSYFPGARPGQGPNRNVVDPRTLCVPGRRALIYR